MEGGWVGGLRRRRRTKEPETHGAPCVADMAGGESLGGYEQAVWRPGEREEEGGDGGVVMVVGRGWPSRVQRKTRLISHSLWALPSPGPMACCPHSARACPHSSQPALGRPPRHDRLSSSFRRPSTIQRTPAMPPDIPLHRTPAYLFQCSLRIVPSLRTSNNHLIPRRITHRPSDLSLSIPSPATER